MTSEELLADAAVRSWKLVIGRLDGLIASADEAAFERQVVPGGNRMRYLTGHLAAVHDRMLPLLGIGDRLYPQLDGPYLENPDRTHPDPVDTTELKAIWKQVNQKLTTAIEQFSPSAWVERHTAVSEEDFAKDPARNRLAVLLSRTNHASSHLGQLLLSGKSQD